MLSSVVIVLIALITSLLLPLVVTSHIGEKILSGTSSVLTEALVLINPEWSQDFPTGCGGWC